MEENFKGALKHVLVHEGGWADHPADPGGATMKGVTLMTYRRHFGRNKSKADLRNISDEELGQIYRAGYWDKCKCDELPSGLDYAVFDAAVNSGPGRGAKWLQYAVGAKQDGGIGAKTLARLDGLAPSEIINTMCDRRLAFLRSLRTWRTFGRGWGRRVESVRFTALEMAGGYSLAAEETAPSVDFEIVRKGSKGPWVRKLQEALEIQVDGVFGSDTEAALKAWQKETGLESDGIAGRITYKALGLID
ncbi:MAG: glycosyl hydrolase 108 family protein [Leptolyngbyaceae cyanobacterium MO_188.B28]|nr:glycosyl hydrolase 108 family protein [Leptolyngbyaceae cyanobacterium MO_188.B28]